MNAHSIFRKYLKLEKAAETVQRSRFATSQNIHEAWTKANKVYEQWKQATGKPCNDEE